MSKKISLYQILKRSGLFESKQAIIKAVSKGKVTVDGRVTTTTKFQCNPNKREVLVNGEKVEFVELFYFILNKPRDYSCQSNDRYPSVLELIDADTLVKNTLFPVGRLDIPTTGLLIITNDGPFGKNILEPKEEIEKKYKVLLSEKITSEQIEDLEQGVKIRIFESYVWTKPAKVKVIDDYQIYLTITEGKYRQVRKMCESVGNRVMSLERVSIGKLVLPPKLYEGNYKKISAGEIKKLVLGK
jgi:16S rRNA pseudouridine516 synthase